MYFFYGTDTETVRSKAFAWVCAARAKEPQLLYTRLAGDSLTESVLEEVVGAGGLFVRRLLVLIDDPFARAGKGDKDEDEPVTVSGAGALIEKQLAVLADSDNAIIILAPGIASALAKRVAAKATKTYCFDLRAGAPAARGFNRALVGALENCNSAALWLEIVRALREGDAPEMLHGLLHWKARDIMQKGARAWSAPAARALSIGLIILLGDARRTGVDFARALERFALSIGSR